MINIDGIKNFGQGIYKGALDLWNDLTGQTSEDRRTAEVNKANLQAVESTNETNKQIAQENLGFQRELQEYNKALQERLFQREDTSYQRTATDMLAAGLNPLAMQGTNGAGEAISQTPLNNQYQAQAAQFQKAETKASKLQAIDSMLSHTLGAFQTINQIKTGQLQRDSLALENDKKYIENMILANSKGIKYLKNYQSPQKTPFISTGDEYEDYKKAENYRNKEVIRNFEHDVAIGRYASDSNFSQALTDLEDWILSGRGEQALDKLRSKFPVLDLFGQITNPNSDIYKENKNNFAVNWKKEQEQKQEYKARQKAAKKQYKQNQDIIKEVKKESKKQAKTKAKEEKKKSKQTGTTRTNQGSSHGKGKF